MYWEVGVTIGAERGRVNVHPATLKEAGWENAVEYALDMTQAMHPDARIEFDYVKEYDND